MNFAEAMKRQSTLKLTENGAIAYDSIGDSIIELFSQIGALRPRTEEEIRNKFLSAYRQNPVLATKMLFYAGNIRGGLGERRTFRVCLHALAQHNSHVVIDNIHNIAYYNRFDSLFELIDTGAEKAMWSYIKQTLNDDFKKAHSNMPVSLLAKWMPSEKAHSVNTLNIYYRALHALGMSPRKYRKITSYLRKYIDVIECKMSAKNWDEIDYSAVPSHAMKKYNRAFAEHDPERFAEYVMDVNKGNKKINSSALFPYDLVKNYMPWGHETSNLVAEEQWRALPNYIEGEHNIVVMADVSDSMAGRPMDTSIGLAIYFAERNKGPYANMYMTFTDNPHFISINPNSSLQSKVVQVKYSDIGYNTDLEAAFDTILNMAIDNDISSKDMPEALVVISDMEIDNYMRGYGMDFVDKMKCRFWDYGYAMPKLILWNVEARNDTYLTQSEDVILVSGQSPAVFKSFINSINGTTREEVMLETLNDPMYDRVDTSSC